MSKLQKLDADYRALHLEIIDLIDEKDTGAIEAEQRHIDQLDDDVSSLTMKLQVLMTPPTAARDATALDRSLTPEPTTSQSQSWPDSHRRSYP